MPNLLTSTNQPPRNRAPFTLQDVRDTFDYCAETGFLYHKGTRDKVVTQKTRGVLYVKIGRKEVSVHRLCWYIHYGEWPAFNLRHLNSDHTDNRITNLARARWVNDPSRAQYQPARGDNAAAGAEYHPAPSSTDTPRW